MLCSRFNILLGAIGLLQATSAYFRGVADGVEYVSLRQHQPSNPHWSIRFSSSAHDLFGMGSPRKEHI